MSRTIPDLKEKSQMELCDLYKTDTKNKDVYLSELVVRYWNIPVKAVAQSKNTFSEEDAYEWYIQAIMYAIDERPWDKESSSLYGNPHAFETVVNKAFFCEKMNWFQASNRFKRKLNHDAVSLEGLSEQFDSTSYEPYIEDNSNIRMYENALDEWKDVIIKAFKEEKYLFALMIDLIINYINTVTVKNVNSLVSTLTKEILSLPEDYANIFASQYNLDKELVVNSFKAIYNMGEKKIRNSLSAYIYKLRALLVRG